MRGFRYAMKIDRGAVAWKAHDPPQRTSGGKFQGRGSEKVNGSIV